MLAELILGVVMVIGFVIGATIWWRCERFLRSGKAIFMIVSAVVAAIGARLSELWFEDLHSNSETLRDDQVLIALLVIGGLSAVLGVPFCEGFLCLYRKMKGTKNQ
jgi:uncharacterized membrane protein YfcA